MNVSFDKYFAHIEFFFSSNNNLQWRFQYDARNSVMIIVVIYKCDLAVKSSGYIYTNNNDSEIRARRLILISICVSLATKYPRLNLWKHVASGENSVPSTDLNILFAFPNSFVSLIMLLINEKLSKVWLYSYDLCSCRCRARLYNGCVT